MDDNQPVDVPIEGSLDLHAFAPKDVLSVVDEYLHAARAKGFREVRLIHGRGRGVQRAAIHRMLRAHPLVASYYDAPESRLGSTVVILAASDRAMASS